MKKVIRFTLNSSHRRVRLGALVLCAGLLGAYPLFAGDETGGTDGKSAIAPAQEEPTYDNWVTLGLGGIIINGNEGQFKMEHNESGPVFGGIDDMHLEKTLSNKAELTLDAHAIFDNNDYRVKLELSKADVGYIRLGYTAVRTWSNGYAGYVPPDKAFPDGAYILPFSNEYALDRSDAWIELGLREPSLPEITLRYDHMVRNGQEDSTEWGSDALTGLPTIAPDTSTRKIVPSWRDINEKRDIITLDVKKTFDKTDFDLGMRYEYSTIDDSLNTENDPGTPATALKNNLLKIPLAAGNYYTTEVDQEQTDLFSGHFSTETRFNDKLWLTMGYSYTSVNTDIGGSLVNGPGYEEPFGNGYFVINNQLVYVDTSEFLNLGGGSQMGQNVGSLNLMWMPTDDLTITPAVRFESDDTDSVSLFDTTLNQTNGTTKIGKVSGVPIVVATPGIAPAPTIIASTDDVFNVAESLDIRYTKIKDWVFYAKGDWEEENEDRTDDSPGTGTASSIRSLDSNIKRMRQKYSIGANWYPLARLNLALQYYHQNEFFDQYFNLDDPSQGNQRLLDQNWNTDDVNFRVTWRALSDLSLVSRYDFQHTMIDSEWESSAPPAVTLPAGESGNMVNHMLSEGIMWNPMNRLYFMGNVSYVLNSMHDPASVETPAVLNFNNNYWTASIGAGYSIDDKTQLTANYSFYRANDYENNVLIGMPYGDNTTEHDISVSLSRQISRNVRVMVKYSFDIYKDQLYGGLDNYIANTIYTCMQIRF